MSIKSEITELIASGEGSVKINEITLLYRWTKDALGNDVDGLHVVFKYVSGVRGGWTKEIAARDYDGIIAEIGAAAETYMQMCAEKMISNLRAGYR